MLNNFGNTPEEKYFAPLRRLYPFIKSFVNPFVGISSTFSDSSYSTFSTNICFVSFEVTLLLIFFSFHMDTRHDVDAP